MTINKAIFILAGSVVIISTLLSIFVSTYWSVLTLFVGFNLFQSAFTGFCPAAMIMKKLGMKE